jgi:hypothetical protein
MNTKERILAALSGRKVDRIPLTVYDILFDQAGVGLSDKRVARLRAKGLGIIRHVETYKILNPGVERITRNYSEGGEPCTRTRLVTPLGEISSTARRGWVQEYFLKSVEDYRIMEYVIRDQVIEPDYEVYAEALREIGDDGIVIPTADRSPYQKILVDLAGLEALSYHLADGPEEVASLYGALAEKQREIFEIVARGPGETIKMWENITGDAMGNDRFEEYHLPIYKERYATSKAAGKLLTLHLDGRLSCLMEGIAKASFDIIESFTPAPEGDVALGDALLRWPGKAMWLTIPSFVYGSDKMLKGYIRELAAASGGKGLALEIAEYYPEATWEHHMDVMLDVLA